MFGPAVGPEGAWSAAQTRIEGRIVMKAERPTDISKIGGITILARLKKLNLTLMDVQTVAAFETKSVTGILLCYPIRAERLCSVC